MNKLIIGETIHNGELISVWEDDKGFYIEFKSNRKYINIDDYYIMKY